MIKILTLFRNCSCRPWSAKSGILIFILILFFVSAKCAAKDFYVLLTFDDGPYPQTTQQILNILEHHKIKSIFFVTAKWSKKYPEMVKNIIKKGHNIGLHGYYHLDLTESTPKELNIELDTAKSVIEKIINQPVLYFRPPAGKYNDTVIKKCKDLNLKMVLWTVYPSDCEEKNAEKIFQRLKTKKFNEYEILLLHNGLDTTIKVLDKIIKNILERNGQFINIEEFIKKARPEQIRRTDSEHKIVIK